ncbi:hypothetical protein HY339_02720 [Candidatus Gottesmanbacteria bacterium]|nr:hypothetical protein [Candidatus Gottesmanbacteria bacterium]
MSTPPIIGDNTKIAKNTFPALSNILDSRPNWDVVNTGSFQMYSTPNDSIGFDDITYGFVRKAYAADGTVLGSSTGKGGPGCAAARAVAEAMTRRKKPDNPVYEILPNNTLIRVGECGPGRECQQNLCTLKPKGGEITDYLGDYIEEVDIEKIDSPDYDLSFYAAQFEQEHGYDLRFFSKKDVEWTPESVFHIYETCKSLPQFWCQSV